jgi:hypothetical protein
MEDSEMPQKIKAIENGFRDAVPSRCSGLLYDLNTISEFVESNDILNAV